MTYDVTIFGINIPIKPVAFSLSLFGRQWDVYWYGIIIATGFLLAILYTFFTCFCDFCNQ